MILTSSSAISTKEELTLCKQRVFEKIKTYKEHAYKNGIKFRQKDLRRLELDIQTPELKSAIDVFRYRYETGCIVLTEDSVELKYTHFIDKMVYDQNPFLGKISRSEGFIGATVPIPLPIKIIP